MAVLQSLDPNVEITGDALLAFINAMGPFRHIAIKRLSKHGIADIRADNWYSLQSCFDAFRELPQKLGNNTVMLIGKLFFGCIRLPDCIDSVEEALMAVNDIYQMHYRNGNAGCYRYRQTGEREGKMFCSSAYPCAFDQGMLDGICNHYKPSESTSVTISHSTETGCRSKGSIACTYIIKW